MSKHLKLFTDGGSRNNPGPAAIGGIGYEDDKVIFTFSKYIGQATNNFAEYTALIEGLKHAEPKGYQYIDCFLDSELVVKQMNWVYKVKHPDIKPLHEKVKNLMSHFKIVTFTYITREKNKIADKLVNEALDAHLGLD